MGLNDAIHRLFESMEYYFISSHFSQYVIFGRFKYYSECCFEEISYSRLHKIIKKVSNIFAKDKDKLRMKFHTI